MPNQLQTLYQNTMKWYNFCIMRNVITIRDTDNGFTQANELIRATRNMGEMAHKLYFFFLAKRSKGQRRIETTIPEVRKALGISKSGQQNKIILEAIKQLERDTIVTVSIPIYRTPMFKELVELGFLEDENIIVNQNIIKSTIGTQSNIIVFDINPLFIPLLDNLEKCYSWVYLENIARLKGRYSYRIYEWIESKLGKREKFNFTWYLDNDNDNEGMGIRQFLGIADNVYKRNIDLKRRVIDPALKEINQKLGFEVIWEYLTKEETSEIYAVNITVYKQDCLTYMRDVFESCCEVKPKLEKNGFKYHLDLYRVAGHTPQTMSFKDFLLN